MGVDDDQLIGWNDRFKPEERCLAVLTTTVVMDEQCASLDQRDDPRIGDEGDIRMIDQLSSPAGAAVNRLAAVLV